MRPYFAYGSNLNPRQFHGRCPGSCYTGTATLSGYRFIITQRGYANVIPAVEAKVHGVLAELTAADETILDHYEGVRFGFYRKELLAVRSSDGAAVTALVYVDNETRLGKPDDGYLELVLEGARFHGLPPAALQEIKAWAG